MAWVSTLWQTHDCIKAITTWAQLLSLTKLTAFCFYLCLTQHPDLYVIEFVFSVTKKTWQQSDPVPGLNWFCLTCRQRGRSLWWSCWRAEWCGLCGSPATPSKGERSAAESRRRPSQKPDKHTRDTHSPLTWSYKNITFMNIQSSLSKCIGSLTLVGLAAEQDEHINILLCSKHFPIYTSSRHRATFN